MNSIKNIYFGLMVLIIPFSIATMAQNTIRNIKEDRYRSIPRTEIEEKVHNVRSAGSMILVIPGMIGSSMLAGKLIRMNHNIKLLKNPQFSKFDLFLKSFIPSLIEFIIIALFFSFLAGNLSEVGTKAGIGAGIVFFLPAILFSMRIPFKDKNSAYFKKH